MEFVSGRKSFDFKSVTSPRIFLTLDSKYANGKHDNKNQGPQKGKVHKGFAA